MLLRNLFKKIILPYFISLCAAKSFILFIFVLVLDAVKNAAKFAV